MRRLALVLPTAALLTASPAAAQQIFQTDWTSGPGTVSSTNLGGETGFAASSGHALHETSPGDVRVVQFVWEDPGGRAEVMPVREAADPVVYYDLQGSGGTPVYPVAACLESRYWLQRNLNDGALAWMFHVNVNGLSSDPCGGEIDATYTITPNGVATLLFSDETGESTLTGFDHFWVNQWADGHVIGMQDPEFNVTGTLDRVVAVTQHDMILDANDNRQGFATSDNMTPVDWSIDATLVGRLHSSVFDTGQPRDWGRLLTTESSTAGVQASYFVRTGTDVADTIAQPYEGPYAPGDDLSSLANSNQQFIQYRVIVTLPDVGASLPVDAEPTYTLEELRIEFDTDGDDLSDETETNAGTDPFDGDSDDDGVADGDEPLWDQDSDNDGLINALDPDSDGDGLFDGTELGLDCSAPDTDPSEGNCIADGDGGQTTTDPLDADSDDGGVSDGDEDTDKDGTIDPGETDPNDGSDDDPGGSGGGGSSSSGVGGSSSGGGGSSSSGVGGSSSGVGGSSSGAGGSSSGGANTASDGDLLARGGCGCQLGDRQLGALGWLSMLALALALTRRRRR